MNTIKTTYRDIAKMLVKAMPVEGQDFADKVEQYIGTIRAMPNEARIALKSAYIFSRKVPREEREDLFQDLALAILKARCNDERLAYSIARCDWKNWWAKYKIRQHYSLDSVVDDGDGGQTTFGELLVGEVDFETRINGDLDGQALYERLPEWIKKLVDKGLSGQGIRGGDRQLLNKWVASKPMMLASYIM